MNLLPLPSCASSTTCSSSSRKTGQSLLRLVSRQYHSNNINYKAITFENSTIWGFSSSCCFDCCCSSSSNKDGSWNQLLHFDLLYFKRPSRLGFFVCCCSSLNQGTSPESLPPHHPSQQGEGLWRKWRANSREMRLKLAKLGLAAGLAYGIFDGITYTTFFVLAFLGFEKSTGKNPAANLQALLGIVILMWTGNNVTRPFRVAGAAALAPLVDRGLKKIQNYFKFPSLVYAFAFVVSIVAALCFTIAGSLILSRWGK